MVDNPRLGSLLYGTLAGSAHRRVRASYGGALRLSAGAAVLLHLLLFQSPLQLPKAHPVDLEAARSLTKIVVIDVDPVTPAAPVRPVLSDVGDEAAELPIPEVVPVAPPEATEWAGPIDFPPPVSAWPASAAPLTLGQVSSPPQVLHTVAASYPELARMAEAEGTVLLEVTVAADGSVASARVVQSDAIESLENAALAAVRQWIFEPARQGNRAVSVLMHVPIHFSLR